MNIQGNELSAGYRYIARYDNIAELNKDISLGLYNSDDYKIVFDSSTSYIYKIKNVNTPVEYIGNTTKINFGNAGSLMLETKLEYKAVDMDFIDNVVDHINTYIG